MPVKNGRNVVALALFAALTFRPATSSATGRAEPVHAGSTGTSKGRPKVVLDQLDLSKVPLGSSDEKYLREVLAREAKRADWGAGRHSQIQYRFRIDLLEVAEEASVVKIQCAATGWLPRGKTAKSKLSFGGAPKERADLVRHVLAIVARGVVTRLAELERQRRLPQVERR